MRRILVGIAIYVLLVPVTWASKGLYLGGAASLGRIDVEQFQADQLGYKLSVGWRLSGFRKHRQEIVVRFPGSSCPIRHIGLL